MSVRLDKPRRPPFAVGVRVQYHGSRVGAGPAPDRIMYVDEGDIGVCVLTQPGWQGSGRVMDEHDDGDPVYDETHDGWSVVQFPSGLRRAVNRDSVRDGRYTRVRNGEK